MQVPGTSGAAVEGAAARALLRQTSQPERTSTATGDLTAALDALGSQYRRRDERALSRVAGAKLPAVQLLFSAVSAYSGGKTMLGGIPPRAVPGGNVPKKEPGP